LGCAAGLLGLGSLSRLGAGSGRVAFATDFGSLSFGALSLAALGLGAFSAFGLLAGRGLSLRVAVFLVSFGSFASFGSFVSFGSFGALA